MAKENDGKKLSDVAPGVEKDLGFREDHAVDDLRPDQPVVESHEEEPPAKSQ